MRKKKLLFTLATVALLLIVACVITAASTEPAENQPVDLKVKNRTLLLEDSVYIRYYVPVEGTNNADVKMLFWLEPQSEYVYGTQDYVLSPNQGTVVVDSAECYLFDFRELAAKQMTVDVYAKVYATDGENEYYSKLNKYSILQYCYYMLGKTSTYEPDADFEELLNSLLTYGASAQKYFGENTDRLATDSYYQIKVKGTTLTDGSTSGLYKSGEQITVTAPATNEAGEDFLYWQNSAGAQVGTELDYTITVGTQNETYTAVYGDKGPVATDASYFTFTELDDGSYSIAAKDVNNMPVEVVIPATYNGKAVTVIGTNAFYNCANLTEITVPDSVTSIGDWAFLYCESLENITLGKNVTSIGFRAFQECKSLISISLPNSVTSIGSSAFEYCGSLASVTLGSNVTSIGEEAFYDCTKLKSVYIADLKAWCMIAFGNSRSNPLYYGAELYLDDTLLSEISIPDDITSIGDSSFSGCSSITSIIVPNGVTSIGKYAFYNCSNLTSVTIADSVTSIGYAAFENCTSLTSITLPFVGNVKDGTSNTHFGYIFGTSFYSDQATYVPASLKTVTITGGTSIGYAAFYGCTNLTSITIPDSVTSIGDNAFQNCSGLTTITIPDGVTSIGRYVFEGCTGLTDITIPDDITSIGESAFKDCSNLTNITIPDSVTNIDSLAFYCCFNITSVYYTGTAENWANISANSPNLTSATIYYYSETQPTDTTNKYWHYVDGEPVVWIPYTGTDASYFTFTELSDGTYSIKAKDVNNMPSWVVIPSNYNGKAVTKIASYAFNDCSNLTGITIPTSIMTIGDHAFSQCYYLDSVTFLGSSDWKISSGATVPSSYLTYSKDAATFIFDHVIETWTRI